jgi:monofunctional biosynthetic peptidoglycan transglycosylase
VPRSPRNYWSIVRRGAKLVAWIVIAWLALVVTLIVAYRFVNPPASALMLQYWLTGQSAAQTWVPFDDISPNVVRAVLLSEDGRFCQHSGIDLEAIEAAIENSDGRSRGGSTISMQVVKNLFLWPSKSYLRKAIELPLTFLMEFVWSKRRIMEVYLNIAEWGPGIFGIGAAAGYHFDKPARNLSVRDAARLAASLPNPLVRNAGRPGPGLQRLAYAIQVRMRLAPSSQLSCVLSRRPF